MSKARSEVSEVRSSQILSADHTSPNVNDIHVPVWLNNDFITNILQNYIGNGALVDVKNFEVKSLGGNGDSYASLMFRVITNYSVNDKNPKTLSLIVKSLPLIELALEKLGSCNYNVQNKEMKMYRKIIPDIRKLLSDIGECPNFAPECYGVEKNCDVMVLEDLAESKYVMACRLKQLDLEHILLSLKKLARMHAASAVIYQQNPKAFKIFNTGFFTRETDVFHVMFESICDALIDEVSTWEGYEYYAKKLPSVRKNLIEYAQRAFDCDDDDFLVLNHGDLWTTNLMFKYDENGRPIDVKIIDFQFSCIGSPALDLIYFLFSSTIDDLRYDRMEELIQFYYYELQGVLSRLNFDMKKFPSLYEFQLQVRKKYFYAVTTSLLVFPIHLSQDKDGSFESLQCTDERAMEFKRRILKNPKFHENARKMLPMLDRRGLLDEM